MDNHQKTTFEIIVEDTGLTDRQLKLMEIAIEGDQNHYIAKPMSDDSHDFDSLCNKGFALVHKPFSFGSKQTRVVYKLSPMGLQLMKLKMEAC